MAQSVSFEIKTINWKHRVKQQAVTHLSIFFKFDKKKDGMFHNNSFQICQICIFGQHCSKLRKQLMINSLKHKMPMDFSYSKDRTFEDKIIGVHDSQTVIV